MQMDQARLKPGGTSWQSPQAAASPAGRWSFREAYRLTTGKAIGHYADGKVAVVENRYGKGKAILFGSLVFQSPENASALLRLLPDEAQAEVDVPPGIFARTLTDDVEKATILINFSDRKLEARVKVDSADQLRLVWGEMEIRREKEYVILDLEPLESAVLVL